MTDNEIVKALECCADEMGCKKDCPFYNDEDGICKGAKGRFEKAILDLINRQKAEIERLKRKLVGYEPSIDSGLFSQMLLEQKEKAEAFEKKWKAEVKSEAYREFAERVKLEFYYEFDELIPSIMSDRIDNLLKELVGDSNG